MVRPIALTAAIAVSLLTVSGAGGSGTQAPRVGGTVVYAAGSEPPCLNILIPACSSGSALWGVPELVLKGAFSFAPGNSLRAQLVSSVKFTKTAPFTLTYHIRPEAHWSDGVQISAKDFVFTHQAIRKYPPFPGDPHLTQVRSVRALGPKTVRVVLRTRFAAWRSLFSVVLPRHALAGEDLTTVWTDRIDNPRRPGLLEAAPSSSSAGSAGSSSPLFGTSATGARIPPTSTGSCSELAAPPRISGTAKPTSSGRS